MNRRRTLVVAALLIGAVPVAFGIIRAAQTGDDFRYLWLAGAALLGSLVVVTVSRAPTGISVGRGLSAVAAGAASAAAAALLQGATAGPGVAVVAIGFGACTGFSAVLAGLARDPRPT